MAAGQGHGAGQQAHQGVEPQSRCEADPHGVLDDQKSSHHQQENAYNASAFFQAGEIGIQADRGEKSQHQGHLQRRIKLHFNVEQTQGQKQQSNHQAPCNGFGNIVGTQKSDTRHESAS